MPKKLTDDLNERIEAEIARYVEGVGIEALHAALAEIVSRRTLQRRLANLADQKRVFISGKGPSLRYRQSQIIYARTHEPALTAASPGNEIDTPVSPEVEEIRRFVRQPRQQRAPVSSSSLSWSNIPRTVQLISPNPCVRNCTTLAVRPRQRLKTLRRVFLPVTFSIVC